ncbi:lantibiotic dehydratase [Dictyobacter alpinus]|uniref:Lantibiotic dehydratase n=1 Tax=Dictyobacter alpinus TaxID=2014873 RepID=A0A402BDU3_9CHLR|nr:lantibiotic dehydratase [Dictyobacter alpinus]GCE29462.1 lantibiotic dehydratase [Dictyobacter alpinus]
MFHDGRKRTGQKQQCLSKQDASLYHATGTFLVRVPAFSLAVFLQLTTRHIFCETSEEGNEDEAFAEGVQHGYEQVRLLMMTSSFFRVAVSLASQDLVQGFFRLHQDPVSPARMKRVYSRLMRYLVRMSTRATPFGLFAGVALGTITDTTQLTLEQHALGHVHVRPDIGWLSAFLREREQQPHAPAQMCLMVNSTAQVVGNRVLLSSVDEGGNTANETLSLRAIPLVRRVFEIARYPLCYTDLVTALSHAFPRLPESQIHLVLKQLWDAHVLMSTLHPPLTGGEPLTFVLQQLQSWPHSRWAQHMREELLSLEPLLNAVHHADLSECNALEDHLSALSARQNALVAHYPHSLVQVDAALTMKHPSLHTSVAAAVEEAADVLLRLGIYPRGIQTLERYRAAFVHKYGMAEVPLLRLLSTESGLGAPTNYTRPPRSYPLPALEIPSKQDQTRDQQLCALLMHALKRQHMEIVLTEEMIQELTQWAPSPEHPAPPEIDVFFQVQATSMNEVDQGSWESLVIQGLVPGGRTMGRFAQVLGGSAVTSLQASAREVEALFPNVVFADLTYLPSDARGANVALRPPLHPYEITVNTMPSRAEEFVLSLDDLVVGVRDNRLYVRSLRLGKEVKVYQRTMLNVRYAPNICRFLLEIAEDGSPHPEPFDWGMMRTAPFLPRVVYKKIVLSLAQWHVRLRDIQPEGKGNEEVRWFMGLQQWRKRWQVPRYVYLTTLDQRLLLDLEHPLLVQELWSELKHAQPGTSICLQEMLPDFDHLICRDVQQAPYIAEMVMPLVLRASCSMTSGAAQVQHALYPSVVSTEERSFLPGEDWMYLKIYIAPLFQDELITGPLREIVKHVRDANLCDEWFYLRYADPDPHLRLRFHARIPDAKETVLKLVLSWAHQLVHAGTVTNVHVVPYEREIERYGGPALIGDIERFFSSNSDMVSELVALQYTKHVTYHPLVVAVMTLDQLFCSWGYDLSARLRHAQAHTHKYASKEVFAAHRKQLSTLLFPWRYEDEHNESLMSQRQTILSLCALQASMAVHLMTHIHMLAAQNALWNDPEHILGSLAHLHLNRLLGIDRKQEQVVYDLWRHVLEATTRRPPG